jgi:hypothetical protein
MKQLLFLILAPLLLIGSASAADSPGELEHVTDHIVIVTTGFARDTSNRLRGSYTGTLLNGIPHGSGRLVHPDAIDATPRTAQWYYEGEFEHGTFHGWGTLYIHGEIEFRGEFAFGDWATPCDEWMTPTLTVTYSDGEEVGGWTPTTITMLVVGIMLIVFGVCMAAVQLAHKKSLVDAEVLLSLVQDDDDVAKIMSVQCTGCATPTNVQVGKSEICEYCGNAVNAPRTGG